MGRCCSVIGCKSNYRSQEGHVATFTVPKDEPLRSKWHKLIPNDLTGIKRPIVCIKHFEESSIVRIDKLLKRGVIVEYPRKYVKLVKGTVPTLFLDEPKSERAKPKPTDKKRAQKNHNSVIESVNDSDSTSPSISLDISKRLPTKSKLSKKLSSKKRLPKKVRLARDHTNVSPKNTVGFESLLMNHTNDSPQNTVGLDSLTMDHTNDLSKNTVGLASLTTDHTNNSDSIASIAFHDIPKCLSAKTKKQGKDKQSLKDAEIHDSLIIECTDDSGGTISRILVDLPNNWLTKSKPKNLATNDSLIMECTNESRCIKTLKDINVLFKRGKGSLSIDNEWVLIDNENNVVLCFMDISDVPCVLGSLKINKDLVLSIYILNRLISKSKYPRIITTIRDEDNVMEAMNFVKQQCKKNTNPF